MGKGLWAVMIVVILALPLAMAVTLNGATPSEKGEDAMKQIKAANTGQEIEDVVAEAIKDPSVKADLLSRFTSQLQGSPAAFMVPAGFVDLIFTSPAGSQVDLTFTITPDKRVTEVGTSSNPSYTYQIFFDETLLGQVRGNPAGPAIVNAALTNGRIRIVARTFLNKYKTVFVVFTARVVSIFNPPPATQQILTQAQTAAQSTPLMCPIFCSYSMQVGDASGGVGIPDCEIKDANACTGQAYTGTKYENCGCQKEAPSAKPCPDTCHLDGPDSQRQCWVDRTLVGKSNVICAGHVFGVGNLAPYQKAPNQPACICRE